MSVYLVTNQQQLFDSPAYQLMSVEDSIKEIKSWKMIQLDSETTGKLKILDYLKTFIRL